MARSRSGQRSQGDEVLSGREQQGEQSDAADGLAAGALEVIVGIRVLELGEVERRRVLHQAHADLVGEQVAEQTLEQGREPCKRFAHHGDAKLEAHEPAEVPPGGGVAGPRRGNGGDDAVDDELADPQHGDGDERPHEPQHENAGRVAAVRLKHEAQKRRDVAQRLEPLTPGRRLVSGLRPGWWKESRRSHVRKSTRLLAERAPAVHRCRTQ
jgi:hypothetical protein